MGLFEVAYAGAVLLFPTLLFLGVGRRVRRLRKFSYVRVLSAHGKPLVGADVFTLAGSAPHGRKRRVGKLDGDSSFRRSFSHLGPQALLFEGPGIASGLIGMPAVSAYQRFPAEPYACLVQQGMLLPPARQTSMHRGLPPGAVQQVSEGFTNRYEAPVHLDEVLCYPTLDEVKKGMDFGKGLNRDWKVKGVRTMDVGCGMHIAAESWERVKG